tara:strand:- start:75 stop:365 length:291 start_codon:yes stop_codon:yes gene_type:complete
MKPQYSWKEQLKKSILEKGLDIGTFTLKELYDEIYTEYQIKYPNNKTIDASIRRNLQGLRRDGFLRFINNQGVYEVISKENEAWATFVEKYHNTSR